MGEPMTVLPDIPVEYIPPVLVVIVAAVVWLLARLNRSFNRTSTLDEHFARLTDVVPGTAMDQEDPR